jgi:hypothetical protein
MSVAEQQGFNVSEFQGFKESSAAEVNFETFETLKP